MHLYKRGDSLPLLLDSLSSNKTPIRKDALNGWDTKTESLPFFSWTGHQRIHATGFDIRMLEEVSCRKVGSISAHNLDYHHNWSIDDLRVSFSMGDDEGKPNLEQRGGFFLDFRHRSEILFLNHLVFELAYHKEVDDDVYTLVGASVMPLPLYSEPNLGLSNRSAYCHDVGSAMSGDSGPAAVQLTFDVRWVESEVVWQDRWDAAGGLVPGPIHQHGVANSLFVAIALGWLVALVMRKNVRIDTYRHSKCNESDETGELEDNRWKLVVANEAFCSPVLAPEKLAACCGVGMQILASFFSIIVLIAVGWLPMTSLDDLIPSMLFLFAMFGLVNGYVTGLACSAFKVDWRVAIQWAMWAFPLFSVMLFLSTEYMAARLSPAVYAPCFGRVCLGASVTCMHSGLMTYWGASYFDFSAQTTLPPFDFYIRSFGLKRMMAVNWIQWWKQKPRGVWLPILHNWLSQPMFGLVFRLFMAGIVSFSVVCVETFFLMVASWMDQYYSSFGVLSIVVCVEVVTICELAILSGYYELYTEGTIRWWVQFSTAGAGALVLAINSFLWYPRMYSASGMYAPMFYSADILWVCVTFFLGTGATGVIATIFSVRIAILNTKKSQRMDLRLDPFEVL